MGISDVKDALDGIPLAKKASPGQMLMLLVVVGFIFAAGIGSAAWFLNDQGKILNAVQNVDSKVSSLTTRVDWIQRSSMTKQDMAKWSTQLDRMNRRIVNGDGLLVPDVPEVGPAPASAISSAPSSN